MRGTNPTKQTKGPKIQIMSAIVPLAFIDLSEKAGDLSHLVSEPGMISFLAIIAFLLIGLLIYLHGMRVRLDRTTTVLRQTQKQMRLTGDHLPGAVMFQLMRRPDQTFQITYLGKSYERIFGIKRNKHFKDARTALDHIYEEDISLLERALRRGTEKAEPADLNIRTLDAAGKLRWVHICAVPHFEENTLYWNGFLQDITASKSLEDELREENVNFKNLFATIDDFLIVSDLDGRMHHANPSFEARLEYPLQQLLNMSIFELFPEERRDGIYKVIAQMQKEESTKAELAMQTRSGEALVAEMHFFQGFWHKKPAIFGVARDVTQRKQTESALRESQEVLQLIMDTIPMSVFWKDIHSVYLGCNKTFIEECGLNSLDEVIGKTPHDLFDPAQAAEIIHNDQRVINSNQPNLSRSQAHTRDDGNTEWREISQLPLHDDDGRVAGVLGIWRDVTVQNQAEERLRRTLDDMERFNELMRGRERRTLELKGEINDLLQQIGKRHKYRTTLEDRS
ncbi:MAG: PAS domain S-box protein [Pontiella sp.]|nr:PAS domain S-box protein [Pontiella sp.]